MLKRIVILITAAAILAGCYKASEIPPPQMPDPATPAAEDAALRNAQIDPADVILAQFSDVAPGEPAAKIITDQGEMTVRLFKKQAPKTVAAFEKLAAEKYYDGRKFGAVGGHKIETGGEDRGPFPEESEFSLELWNFRGAVALAETGSGFMIVTAAYSLNPAEELKAAGFPAKVTQKYGETGGAPHQDWRNTVFGQVVNGMEIADAISWGKTATGGDMSEAARIISVEIITL